MTDVTIRGIDDETYAQFAAEAKRRGVCVGDLTTQAMKAIISNASEPSFKIAFQEELSVSKTDLESVEAPVTFENIEVLEFDESVDWPTFNKHVREITNVEVVVLHGPLSKFQVLTRGKDIETFKKK